MLSRFFGLFVSRTFWVIVGLIAVSLLIWFIGPLVAIAEFRPLEPEWVRWTLIGLIIGIYILRVIIRLWMSKNINARLINIVAEARTQNENKADEPGANEVKELKERFGKALEVLKKTSFSQDGAKPRWWRPKQYLYQLPWYVFIGAPGSGKTTALLNSGLQFPLAEQLGKAAVRGVGGTRNCDWWFTNEAVLLDTAGRYTTQESSAQVDHAEWQGFLKLLKRFRPRQPINGVLLTISVTDLMTMSETDRELQAAAFRHRLNELQTNLNIRFPVYVLITKCDMLAGFEEYFGRFTKEERAQVWGFTLPFDTKAPFSTTGFQPTWFKEEFSTLVSRIYRGVPDILLEEQDLERKAKIYALPQNFSGLEELLEKMLSSVFSSSRYEDQALLRGVYFTSGTQDGSPFDRVLGILSRRFNVNASIHTEAHTGKGKSFFLEDLQKKIIFAEAHLAGRNFRWERKLQFIRTVSLIILFGVFAGMLVGWTLSYHNNIKYITEVEASASNLAQIVQKDGSRLAGQLVDLFPILDLARNLAISESFPIDEPPTNYRFGLYQGNKLDAAAQSAYRRLLEESLSPIIARRLEEQVKNASADNPEFLYEALKSYLMLFDEKHFDSDVMIAWVLTDWERNLPPSIPVNVKKNLLVHLSALLGDRYLNSPFEKNEALIQLTRQKLAGFTLSQRIYSRLKRRLIKSDMPEFTIAGSGGSQAALVFSRKSGQPISRGIPALFTYAGYHERFDKEVTRVSATLAFEESWVLGDEMKSNKEKLDDLNQKRLVLEVKRLYMHEYVRLWENYLGDIKLLPSQSLAQSVEVSRVLSGPDSPLAQLLRAVAKETTLTKVQKQDSASLFSRAKDRINSTKSDLEQVFGPIQDPTQTNSLEKPEFIVDNRFEPLRRFAASSGTGGSQLDQTLQLINQLYTTLAATEAALKGGNTPPNSDIADKLKAEAARLPMPLRSMVEGLTTLGARQIAGVARASISGNMSASVGDFCRTAIEGRYPINASSSKDITPDDFGRMFGPNGVMDDFFQRNLATLVDISKNPWTFRPGASGPSGADSNALAQFQKAQTIRDIFFRSGSRTPGLRLDIKTVEMDPSITQFTLDIDGQIVRYSHGPQVPVSVSWPGPRGSGQIRAQVSPTVNTTGLMFEGPWALHRLFDRMQISRGASSERFIATLTLGGRRIVFEVTANSVQNPFKLSQLETFQCPAKL